MFTRLLWVALSVLAITACSGTAADPTSTSSSTSSTTTTVTSTTEVLVPPVELISLTEGLPRTGRYSILEFTIEAAAIGNVEPRTYTRDEREASAATYVFVEATMDNRSDSEAVNWPPSPMALRLADGSEVDPIMVTGRPHIGLAPLTATDLVVAFEVPASTALDSVAFVLRQEDRIASILPLVGPVPDIPYPIDLALIGTGPAQSTGVGCRQSLEVTVNDGVIGIDLLDASWPSTYGARRAATGDRFLSIGVEVLNNGGSRCGGGASNFSSDDARLVVDGRPLAPITFVNMAIPLDAVETATFDFAFPENANDVTFTIGSEDATLFELPIELPALPDV